MLDSRPLDMPVEIHQRQDRDRSHSLRQVLLVLAGLMLIIALVDQWGSPLGESRAHISVAMGLVVLLLLLAFRNHVRWWGVPVLVVSVLAIGAWASYSYGTVRASATLALLGAVVLAGAYLKPRSLLLTTLAGLALLGGLTWTESTGRWMRPDMAVDVRYWLVGSVVIGVVGAVLFHLRRMTDEAHRRLLIQMEDRVRLEHERDRSFRRFQRVFDLNPTALMIESATSHRVLQVNPAFEQAMGYRADQLDGVSVDSLWADAQQREAHRARLAQHGCTEWQRARWLRPDGQVMEVQVYSELSEDHGGQFILTTLSDLYTP